MLAARPPVSPSFFSTTRAHVLRAGFRIDFYPGGKTKKTRKKGHAAGVRHRPIPPSPGVRPFFSSPKSRVRTKVEPKAGRTGTSGARTKTEPKAGRGRQRGNKIHSFTYAESTTYLAYLVLLGNWAKIGRLKKKKNKQKSIPLASTAERGKRDSRPK